MAMNNFLSGLRTVAPALIASAPFGLLVGAMAVEHGLTVSEAVLMSAVLFAGASQLVGLELFSQAVSPWLVLVSIIAVNLRMVLYSAGLTPFVARWSLLRKAIAFHVLTDVQYAEVERRRDMGFPVSYSWYMGVGLPFLLLWVAEAWVGALFGKRLEDPAALGIDFLVSLYFLGIVMGFRKRPLWLPIVIASGIAAFFTYKILGSPWHITIGALAGIAVGVVMAPEPVQSEARNV